MSFKSHTGTSAMRCLRDSGPRQRGLICPPIPIRLLSESDSAPDHVVATVHLAHSRRHSPTGSHDCHCTSILLH
jgi:hypothetical protein